MDQNSQRGKIRAFMASRGLKIQPWAQKAGIAEGTLRNYLKGRTKSMTQDSLDRLARAADATIAEMIGEKLRTPRPGKDIAMIQSLEVRAGMGNSFAVVEEPEGPPFYFRKQWIERLLEGRHGELRVITRLTGDSMAPTISDGDVALVLLANTVQPKFQSGAIYALWDGNGLVVKRLESMPGSRPRLRVISDNRAIFEPYEVDAEDVRIIGQVLWRGGPI